MEDDQQQAKIVSFNEQFLESLFVFCGGSGNAQYLTLYTVRYCDDLQFLFEDDHKLHPISNLSRRGGLA